MNSLFDRTYIVKVISGYTLALVAVLTFGIATRTPYDGVWVIMMLMCAVIGLLNLRRGMIKKALFELGVAAIFAILGVVAFRILAF